MLRNTQESTLLVLTRQTSGSFGLPLSCFYVNYMKMSKYWQHFHFWVNYLSLYETDLLTAWARATRLFGVKIGLSGLTKDKQ